MTPETIHLTSDHDHIGEPLNWCGEESLKTTESFAQTTCIGCLKTVKIYAEGAAERLLQLDSVSQCHERYAADKKNPDGSNKSYYGKGIQGMDGETAIKLFQEGAKR